MYSMGGLSELAVMPELAVAVVPDELALNDSAIFGCALLTAFGSLRHVADLQEGETVAVIGAGGVGLNVVQLARALGAGRVVAVDVDAEKLETAKRIGASDASTPPPPTRLRLVRELTDRPRRRRRPRGDRPARDVPPGDRNGADGGRCVMIGIAAAGRLGEVEIARLVRRKLQVLGSYGGRPRSDLGELTALAVRGAIDPGAAISRRYTLDEAGEAYAALARGEIVGRALVEM